ncbi:SPW repeat protein [Streptomyces sp. NPDC059999]|uniref:SPW repeat domain-containing protein n=1 Tax=Streptomyces sp. NPDC059999 TaxID=3347030 RepID=UPI0036A3002A
MPRWSRPWDCSLVLHLAASPWIGGFNGFTALAVAKLIAGSPESVNWRITPAPGVRPTPPLPKSALLTSPSPAATTPGLHPKPSALHQALRPQGGRRSLDEGVPARIGRVLEVARQPVSGPFVSVRRS